MFSKSNSKDSGFDSPTNSGYLTLVAERAAGNHLFGEGLAVLYQVEFHWALITPVVTDYGLETHRIHLSTGTA